jgi:hypothetical protein
MDTDYLRRMDIETEVRSVMRVLLTRDTVLRDPGGIDGSSL